MARRLRIGLCQTCERGPVWLHDVEGVLVCDACDPPMPRLARRDPRTFATDRQRVQCGGGYRVIRKGRSANG